MKILKSLLFIAVALVVGVSTTSCEPEEVDAFIDGFYDGYYGTYSRSDMSCEEPAEVEPIVEEIAE